jgi:ribosomal protein L40E
VTVGLTCRRCGAFNADRHHAVNRSLGGHDGPIVELCRRCHDEAHAKKFDVLSLMDKDEQAEAVRILGIVGAYKLLAPTGWKVEA